MAYNRAWIARNQEHIKAYREAHKEERNASRRERYANDEVYRKKAIATSNHYHKQDPFRHRRSSYKITSEQFELMENDGCAICGANPYIDSGVKMHVDHDHRTGKVRGLLCQRCNLALGHFYDDPILLLNAIRYLMETTNG